MTKIQLYATAPYACGYLDEHQARSQVATSEHAIDYATYSVLIQKGFRRSGQLVYRPHCDHCQSCISARVVVDGFKPNRTQRRAWSRHQDLQASLHHLHFHEDHFRLYQRYQQQRHPAGGMDQDGIDQYKQFLLDSHVETRLVEFRDADQVVRMVSIIDLVTDGLSSVYTFYDPDEAQTSYGTYNILWQIYYASSFQLPYVYLGYWIKESRKMAYKENFQPLELLRDGVWQSM